MFPSIPPASNDMSQAYTLLAAASDPKSTKDRLDQINQAMSQLKAAQDELNQQKAQLERDQADFKSSQEDTKSLREELAKTSEDLKNRLDKADARDVEAATKEKELLIRERSVSDIEIKHKEKDNYLGNMHQDLMNKHQSLDQERAQVAATQSALDQRIAKINSVLQS